MDENREWRERHAAYLSSAHWQELRTLAFREQGTVCAVCKTPKGLVGHHMIYRTPLEDGTTKDILCMCGACHKFLHNILKARRLTIPTTKEATIAVFDGRPPVPVELVKTPKPIPIESLDLTQQVESAMREFVSHGANLWALNNLILRLQRAKQKLKKSKPSNKAKGWTRERMEAHGISWPPKKGWLKQLQRKGLVS